MRRSYLCRTSNGNGGFTDIIRFCDLIDWVFFAAVAVIRLSCERVENYGFLLQRFSHCQSSDSGDF